MEYFVPKASAFDFKYKSATATVSVFAEKRCWVYNVQSDKRKKGHATGLMLKIVKWADKHGYDLKLTADAFGENSFKKNKDLAEFYKRFGFTNEKNPPVYLRRKAK
jgi:GNAT superfamily N-acetyltransferase